MIKVTVGSTATASKVMCSVDKKPFPGGEENVQVITGDVGHATWVKLDVRLTNSSEVMKLLFTVDSVKRMYPGLPIHLFMPYIPYARQDRVCNEGEAFTLRVFTDLINGCGFSSVTVMDPHSDVAPALINNVKIVTVDQLILKHVNFGSDWVVLSPDQGAYKKAHNVAKALGLKEVACATKVRDVATGRITQTHVPDWLEGRNVIVVDDIVDGGATFEALATEMDAVRVAKKKLWVTHGIFSKGEERLCGMYDEVYSTNSFKDYDVLSAVKCINVFQI